MNNKAEEQTNFNPSQPKDQIKKSSKKEKQYIVNPESEKISKCSSQSTIKLTTYKEPSKPLLIKERQKKEDPNKNPNEKLSPLSPRRTT